MLLLPHLCAGHGPLLVSVVVLGCGLLGFMATLIYKPPLCCLSAPLSLESALLVNNSVVPWPPGLTGSHPVFVALGLRHQIALCSLCSSIALGKTSVELE